MAFEEIVYAEDGPVGTITLDRPDDGNTFTPRMCHIQPAPCRLGGAAKTNQNRRGPP